MSDQASYFLQPENVFKPMFTVLVNIVFKLFLLAKVSVLFTVTFLHTLVEAVNLFTSAVRMCVVFSCILFYSSLVNGLGIKI